MTLETFYIKTFGCAMNYADSEKVHMILLSAGLRKVIDPTKADIIILNTCSVRQKGEDRVFGFMHEMEKYHHSSGFRPLFGITGCMVRKSGISREHLKRLIHLDEISRHQALHITRLDGVSSIDNYDDALFLRTQLIDFTFRIEEVGYLTQILTRIAGRHIGNDAKFHEYLQVKQLQSNPSSANIIIQTGCDNFCSFCIVPFTRGREVSRGQEEIVGEVREVVAQGTREVTLLGQNVNSYGKETKKKLWNPEELTWVDKGVMTPFRDLLSALGEIEGLDRIRFTSSNPHDMTRDILDAHFDVPHMCPYLHFALQSGSDSMLRRMNRKHTYADFRTQVEYLRSRDPLFSISTDIIVGFPGETIEEFEATAHAMRECQFDFAYIARYSVRSGTRAADSLEDDVSPQEKARRWSILNDILRETVALRSRLLIGTTQEVLVASFDDEGRACGRTRNFKEVYLESTRPYAIGEIVRTEVYELDGWVLRGREIM